MLPHQSNIITKKLSSFFNYSNEPAFYYTIHQEDLSENILYQSDYKKLYASPFLVYDGANLNITSENGKTFMGLGQRAGNLFIGSETYGIHSLYTLD